MRGRVQGEGKYSTGGEGKGESTEGVNIKDLCIPRKIFF